MKKIYAALCIAAVVILMSALFRPGYRIVVNGQALPGIFETELTLRCSTAAVRAAEEITRTHEAPSYTLIPVLCLKHTPTDEQQLRNILLDSYEGVVKMYEVSMNGTSVGTVSKLRDVYLIKNKYFPVWSPNTQLTIKESYTYPEAETPAEQVESVFRMLSSPVEPV